MRNQALRIPIIIVLLVVVSVIVWNLLPREDDPRDPTWYEPFQPGQCDATGNRQFAAQINAPQGMSWEAACMETGATILGQEFSGPDRCEPTFLGLAGQWGVFSVIDPSCNATWYEPFQPGQCVALGTREFAAQINAPQGVSWEVACGQTGATILGQEFSRPDHCEPTFLGVGGLWGVFNVIDPSCNATWKLPFQKNHCVALGIRQYSAQLDVPLGVSWEVACGQTGASILGQEFSRPDQCVNTGLTGIWGQFNVNDATCNGSWILPFKRDHCVRPGVRQYSAQLDVPFGSWETACEQTGAIVEGQEFSRPTRCVNTGLTGIWGEFDVNDASCR